MVPMSDFGWDGAEPVSDGANSALPRPDLGEMVPLMSELGIKPEMGLKLFPKSPGSRVQC